MFETHSSKALRIAAFCAALSFTGILYAGEPGKMTREVWIGIPGSNLTALTENTRYWQPADVVSTFTGSAVRRFHRISATTSAHGSVLMSPLH